MGETTNISWCDHTFNPWIGCTKVGPAGVGCYAEALMSTDGRMKRVTWGKPGQRATHARTAPSNWKQPLKWDREQKYRWDTWDSLGREDHDKPAPRFVFCASLADVFDNDVPPEWRRDLFDLIRATPHLTWLLLTKRPQNIVKLFDQATRLSWVRPDEFNEVTHLSWPRNAAIGCTVVTQAEADRDVPHLLLAKRRLKPAFAFLSMEPLLGPVDLSIIHLRRNGESTTELSRQMGDYIQPLTGNFTDSPKIDWVITGGETDQGSFKARPSHPDWFRSLRDQCAAAGVPFHHKQNGEWAPGELVSRQRGVVPVASRCGDNWHHDEEDLASYDGHADDEPDVYRVGKKDAGRLLDGVAHNARPAVAHG